MPHARIVVPVSASQVSPTAIAEGTACNIAEVLLSCFAVSESNFTAAFVTTENGALLLVLWQCVERHYIGVFKVVGRIAGLQVKWLVRCIPEDWGEVVFHAPIIHRLRSVLQPLFEPYQIRV